LRRIGTLCLGCIAMALGLAGLSTCVLHAVLIRRRVVCEYASLPALPLRFLSVFVERWLGDLRACVRFRIAPDALMFVTLSMPVLTPGCSSRLLPSQSAARRSKAERALASWAFSLALSSGERGEFWASLVAAASPLD
jgi:hypothetical protein